MQPIGRYFGTLQKKVARAPKRIIILATTILLLFLLFNIEWRILNKKCHTESPARFEAGTGPIIDEYVDVNDIDCHMPVLQLDTRKLAVKKTCSEDPLNFFLLWSTKREDFRLKHFRIIDSIFKYHPKARLHLLTSNMTLNDFAYYVGRYDIVHHYLDTKTIFKGTPLERWAQNIPQYKLSSNYFSHLTDAMRLALLWKYGGVYLDTDAVLIRNIDNVRNALGVQHPGYIASGEINGKSFDLVLYIIQYLS